MAPAQLIEPKDLPPEISPASSEAVAVAKPAQPETVRSTAAPQPMSPTSVVVDPAGERSWESGLEAEAMELLAAGRHDVWEALTKRFESRLILTALANTRGRRIEAAQRLGIGRNTITRKIQELGLE
jgi:two-component system nitrogen regulation response regulator GlnG